MVQPVEGDAPLELSGTVVEGRFRLTQRLGSGAVGAVYLAEDLSGGEPLAIKVWSRSVLDPQATGRFQRETKALTTLVHPNIVAIRDYGLVNGSPYLAMELLRGETLEHRLHESGAVTPPPLSQALVWFRQILAALSYAHSRQVVHRDLKPENVFLAATASGEPQIKLLDYGLAKFLTPNDDPARAGLTSQGTVIGTPLYMAPEQALGGAVDTRADVYAAGCVLFELLTGQPPFLHDSTPALLRAHLSEAVPRLSQLRPDLERLEDLQQVLDRALAKTSEERYADAAEMLRALERATEPRVSQPPPAAQAAAAAAPLAAPAAPAPAAAQQGSGLGKAVAIGLGLLLLLWLLLR